VWIIHSQTLTASVVFQRVQDVFLFVLDHNTGTERSPKDFRRVSLLRAHTNIILPVFTHFHLQCHLERRTG
jgi:hypothetical protein